MDDPVLGIPLTVSMTYEEWISIADVLTAATMHRDKLPAWSVTNEDVAAADKLHAAVSAISDLRVKVLGND